MQCGPSLVGHDCAGIDAPRWALRNVGVVFESSWVADIDPRCERLLKEHISSDKLLVGPRDGDITKRAHNTLPACDVYIAGFPCQGLSRMGRRLGMDDPRTHVFFDVLDTVREIEQRVVILENVSSLLEKDMEDTWYIIRHELEGLAAEKGYIFAWATMNARDHGLPMSRPRIFMLLFKKQHYNGSFL